MILSDKNVTIIIEKYLKMINKYPSYNMKQLCIISCQISKTLKPLQFSKSLSSVLKGSRKVTNVQGIIKKRTKQKI